MVVSYLLIDCAMLDETYEKIWVKKEKRFPWITSVYGRSAAQVSPIIIDVQQAVQASKIEVMMRIVNSLRTRLGVSIINTPWSLVKLTDHLKKFIYIMTATGEQLTLRFADCAVLPALHATLHSEQWAALTEPFFSWRIHDRDGNLFSLPVNNHAARQNTPLIFTDEQVLKLQEFMAPDKLLFNLKIRHPASAKDFKTAFAHEAAAQSRQMWLKAGNIEDDDLMLFTELAIASKGKLLHVPDTLYAITVKDSDKRKEILENIAEECSVSRVKG